MALGAVKIALLVCLGTFEVGPDRTKESPQEARKPVSGEPAPSGTSDGAWTVRIAQAQEPQPEANQTQSRESGGLGQEWEALRKEKRRLERRRKSLQELEERLDQKLAREKKLKQQLEKVLEEARVMKDEKIKHLVDVYSNMQPEQAAKVLETLDKDIAVKILAGMRGRTAGEILSFVQAEKAARLSEQLTDFQTPFAKE